MYVKVLSCDRKDAFAYRHVLITGGSSGIGYAIAEKILKGGGKVCVTGRDRLKLETAQKRLGEGCKILVFDIADIGKIHHRFYQAIEQLGGNLDTVVSNAGIFYEKSFCDYTSEDWERICNINLAGGYFLAQEAIRYFLNNKIQGNILFTSSERGIMSDTHIYGIAKAGVNSLIKGLARQYAGNGIRINGVAPGMTASGINSIDSDSNLYHPSVAGKRVIRPEEIAEVAAFLISNASVCINGEIIACDNANYIR